MTDHKRLGILTHSRRRWNSKQNHGSSTHYYESALSEIDNVVVKMNWKPQIINLLMF